MQGDNSTNDPGAVARVAPAVRVEDEAGKAISSATVVFMLPTEGASGEFSNHSRTLTIVTDNDGYAVAKGLRTNQIQGKIPIFINASYRGITSRTTMTLINGAAGTNSGGTPSGATPSIPAASPGSAKSHSNGKLVAILLGIGGAAAAGAAVALRSGKQGGSPAVTPAPAAVPIGVVPGTGTVAAPPR